MSKHFEDDYPCAIPEWVYDVFECPTCKGIKKDECVACGDAGTFSNDKLYQCPYCKATKCDLKDPCLGCETFCEYLLTKTLNT